jgi:hypothetical protein
VQDLYLSVCQRWKLKLFYDRIRYLFTAIGFPPGGSGPYTCTKKARTAICIRRNSTDQRTHKRESKTLKIRNKNQKFNNNWNGLKHNQGRMTMNKLFKDKYANNETTYCTTTLIHKYTQMLLSVHQNVHFISLHFTSLPFTAFLKVSWPTLS